MLVGNGKKYQQHNMCNGRCDQSRMETPVRDEFYLMTVADYEAIQ